MKHVLFSFWPSPQYLLRVSHRSTFTKEQIVSVTELEDINHTLFPVKSHLKADLLRHILDSTETGAVIVCTRTRLKAKNTARQLVQTGLRAVSLESRPEYAGLLPLQSFTEGNADILVVYEAAAQEAPLRPLTHLIYHDIPYTAKGYFRLLEHFPPEARPPEVFSLISAETSGAVHSLEMYLELDLERRILPEFNYDIPSRPSSGSETGSSLSRRPGKGGKGKERGRSPNGRQSGSSEVQRHAGSRSEEGGHRQRIARPERGGGRGIGSSREWMEKESRHLGKTESRPGDGAPRKRPGSPSSQPANPARNSRKKSIFGITAPRDREEE